MDSLYKFLLRQPGTMRPETAESASASSPARLAEHALGAIGQSEVVLKL